MPRYTRAEKKSFAKGIKVGVKKARARRRYR